MNIDTLSTHFSWFHYQILHRLYISKTVILEANIILPYNILQCLSRLLMFYFELTWNLHQLNGLASSMCLSMHVQYSELSKLMSYTFSARFRFRRTVDWWATENQHKFGKSTCSIQACTIWGKPQLAITVFTSEQVDFQQSALPIHSCCIL